jgi:ABC-type multidrug transport system fused ATPase/permease subunit
VSIDVERDRPVPTADSGEQASADEVAPPVPATTNWSTMLRRYARVIRPERKLAVTSVILYAISGAAEGLALGMLVPLFQQVGASTEHAGPYTRLLTTLGFHGSGLAWAAVAAFALLGLVASASKFGASATTAVVRTRLEARLRKGLTERLLAMEWSAFVRMRFDEMANSLMMESFQVGAGIQQFLIAIGSLCVILALTAMALLLSVTLTLAVIGFAVVSLVVLKPMGRRAEGYTRGWTSAALNIARQVAEVLGNLKFFRSAGIRGTAQSLFSREYDRYATWFARILISPFSTRLIYEFSALAFLTGLLAVSYATSSLSTTTLVLLAVFFRITPRVGDLQSGLVSTRVQLPWLIRWDEREVVAGSQAARRSGTLIPSFRDSLEFDDVSFAFSESGPIVLDEVSWRLQPGKSIAFVGESGAGKSTMLDLVTGLLAPTNGHVTIDGASVRDIDIEAWQSHIGLVLQESPLFHATVRENIVGGGGGDDELVWECLDAAHAKRFVRLLPEELDTVIGERGGRLSGGERQRIGLARALYRQPWLLVLDEATSQLDSVSEEAILDALRELKGRVAMLIVAHRLATVEMADRIHVLEGGRIVQSGPWSELMSEHEGPFARMAARQGLLIAATP